MALFIARRWGLWPWKALGCFYPIMVFVGLFFLGMSLGDRFLPVLGAFTIPFMTVWAVIVAMLAVKLIREPLGYVFFFLSEGNGYIFTYKGGKYFATYRGRESGMFKFEMTRFDNQNEFTQINDFYYLLPPEVVLSSMARAMYD